MGDDDDDDDDDIWRREMRAPFLGCLGNTNARTVCEGQDIGKGPARVEGFQKRGSGDPRLGPSGSFRETLEPWKPSGPTAAGPTAESLL